MKKISKYILALLIIIVPTFFFLLEPGQYWNMHDDMQIIRQLEMEKCLLDGQVPCRWTPDLGYGYGYPLFNFYPPLPYIVGEGFRLFGFSFVMSVKLTAVLQIITSALAMYLLGSALFGSLGGLISAVFYAYAPYRAVNIFVRGAMNESWASVFFPLIFYYSRELIIADKFYWKKFIFLSLSISGLLLSHNPMALTFSPFVGMWCLFWLMITKSKVVQKTLHLLSCSILALCTTAYYTVPVLLESKYVQIESMFQNYYHYSVHFVSLKQLFFSNFWGDGPSVWGTNDGMSFMVGYIHWTIPLLLVFLSIYSLFKKSNINIAKTTLLLVSMGFIATLMTHQKSGILWQYVTVIQKIQFPWRFLSHSSFLLALTAGALGVYTKNKQILVIPLIILVIALNWSHYTPITSGPISDDQKMSGLAWQNQITSGIYDYLPKTARIAPQSAAKPIVDTISPPTVKHTVSGLKNGSNWVFFNIDLDDNAILTLSRLAYPGWQIYDYGNKVDYIIEPELGRFQINLSASNHQIYLKFTDTVSRTISNIISLLSVTFLLWKLLKSTK